MNQTISAEQESAAMREIGRLRLRTFSVALAIMVLLHVALFILWVGMGIGLALVGASFVGASLAKLVVRLRDAGIVRVVAKRHNIPDGVLQPPKYLLG